MTQKYVELDKLSNGNLRITWADDVTDEDKDEIRDTISTSAWWWPLGYILEWHLGNGWEFIAPEDLGFLTSAPIISDDCHVDDDGNLGYYTRLYWYPDYQIHDPVEVLFDYGSVEFKGE